ncbi:spore coat protein YutH [Lentibacillus persicus]|uniref:Spore coat protein YutH n=1 Tax=Lentibacillus persicus TaxID=640948 RepID=A0A1I1WH46_9BACI|nr:hypothetical protein [Lentibacillus persicus]SFD94309.1 spore coat protein YutH [Lentibacillus persicus]
MRDFLDYYYGIQPLDVTEWNGAEGFKDDNYIYFTISCDQKEIIHMEQAALAYFLYENDYSQMTIPLPNNQNEWYTLYNEKYYLVLCAEKTPPVKQNSQGEQLAVLHAIGAGYPYEPQTISSYGQWRPLWIEKMAAFEEKIQLEARELPNNYYRLLMDSLPYITGLSENAIQYMQESESESRFHEADQGTIVFTRYHGQLNQHFLWMTDLAFDHPARDLAELIRYKLLEKEDPVDEICAFLDDYQKVVPLSIFGWRLLYARLLYPIHLYDIIGRGFLTRQHGMYDELKDMLERQTQYEKRMRYFFENAGVDSEKLQIPVLHWL